MQRPATVSPSRNLQAAALALVVAAVLAKPTPGCAQSLCDQFHVPPAHIGNVQGCVFGANNTTTITFNAPTILNWDRGFRVNPGQHLRFDFGNMQNGAVLNRDLSGAFSNIAGTVSSNGRVMLINPSGIAIQSTGIIEADRGFLGSTLDTQDDESLLAGGDAEFRGDRFSLLENRGRIRSSDGDVLLFSGTVNNYASGEILAPTGSIYLAAGTHVRMAAAGEPRIMVLDGPTQHIITNLGTIEAAREIDLSAFTPNPVPVGQRNPSVINRGMIRTTAADGRVFLRAAPGGGQILNAETGVIESTLITIEGGLINQGTLLDRDDGANPGAPTGTRQFPRLTTSALTQTPRSDFRISRLSFSHLNGLEAETRKKSKRSVRTKTTIAANTATTRGPADEEKRRTSPSSGKKIVLRRGAFFGKRSQ